MSGTGMEKLMDVCGKGIEAYVLERKQEALFRAIGKKPYVPTLTPEQWLTPAQVEQFVAHPKVHKKESGPDVYENSIMLHAKHGEVAAQDFDKAFRMLGFFRCAKNMLRKFGPYFQAIVEYPDRTVFLFDDVAAFVGLCEDDSEEEDKPASEEN
jgi:hypothetical protein